jgi:peptidoglycan/xylan/chitin deacetylase (PgdA/CDA1 family)
LKSLSQARRLVVKASKSALRTVPLAAWQRLFPRNVIGPMYHVVSDERLPHLKHYPYKNREQFEADVAYASEHGGFLRYEELAECRLRGGRVKPNSFLFTFDDGFAECFTVIRPILEKYAASAVFFVTTELIDNAKVFFEARTSLAIDRVERLSNAAAAETLQAWGLSPDDPRTQIPAAGVLLGRGHIRPPASEAHRLLILYLLGLNREDEQAVDDACHRLGQPEKALGSRPLYLTSEQIRQLASAGFTIGGHSVSHRYLQKLSAEEMEREIVDSCDAVRQITGQKKVPFAFPYSGAGVDRPFLADLSRRHPEIELFFDTGGFTQDERFVVHRFWADHPSSSTATDSNLPELLLDRWSHPSAWRR